MTTEKLEPKYIIPYLSYGLKCMVDIHYETNVIKTLSSDLIGVRFHKKQWQYLVTPYDVKGNSWDQSVHVAEIKPLLIPLSELTEEQWIEVFKAGDDDHLGELNSFKFSNNLNAVIFCFDRTECWFSFKNLQFETSPVKFNQLAAFNKLYELHADLHGLISKGLALTTEQKNRMIAEFMGYFNWNDHEYGKYDISWDWLMPVVEKIEAMGWPIDINMKGCMIYSPIPFFDKADTKLSAVYEAVIKFIEYHNHLNQQP